MMNDEICKSEELWCSCCANDYGRLKELRKEFMG